MNFYTMLYIKDKDVKSTVSENGLANILNYIKCCKTLDDSLKKYGFRITILTNEPEIISFYENQIEIEKIEFKLKVPDDIKFYAAHYKIDVYNYFSKLDTYSILLDNDIICINDMPENVVTSVAENIPMYYDITDQVYPAYSRKRIIDDKSLIMEKYSLGIWAGGEFIGGDNKFFSEIYKICMNYWNNYLMNYKSIHHQSDETVTSCAIEEYLTSGKFIFNVGTVGGIARYWSVKTLHKARPLNTLYDNFLLHIPADKEYLCNPGHNIDNYMKSYQKYLRISVWINKIKRKMKNWIR
ncbi:hypothetical protein AGMMS49940_18080 [Spirochaetia bacterium]|nr:hypothetical protein AGMMS49940_18080 [Spirochaetia bacterium]